MTAAHADVVVGGVAGAQVPAVRCENLVRIFSVDGGQGEARVEVGALQGLDLHVDSGELVAIVGASGSGKSTLLTILSGLDTPSAGSARVAGHDLLAMGRAERVRYQRHTVGFVWQQAARNLLPYLSAAQNVAVPMAVTRMRRPERRERVHHLLDLLGVGEQADRRPSQLSGGQQQRVAIAVALANSPQVLLADEPTGELDSATSDEVFAAFREANRELGVTVVVVTHDQAVSDQVQRTIAIRDGRTSSEVLRRTVVSDSGEEQHVAEEFAVLDAAGRLQLPREFVAALQLERRVRLALDPDHIQVRPEVQALAQVAPAAEPPGEQARGRHRGVGREEGEGRG